MLIDDTDAEIVFPKIFANLLEQLFFPHSKNLVKLQANE